MPLIAQYVRVYLADQRKGTASAKTRAEVSGGGKKPWRQKGTGRARHGSTRSPIWVGGGVAHGPKPRDWSLKMPQKMRRKALLSALALAEKEGRLLSFPGPELDKVSSVKMSQFLESKKLEGRVLVVLADFNGKDNKKIYLSARNLEKVDLARAQDLNAYGVARAKNIVFLGEATETFGKAISAKESEAQNVKSQMSKLKTKA